MRTLTAAVLVLGVAGLTGADDKKADPTGTWKWTTEFGGQKREQTLKLKVEGDKVTGTLSGGRGGGKGAKGKDTPAAATKIEDGTFKDGEIKFTVTRERGGMKTVSKYTGKLTGDTIKGTVETNRDGEAQKRDWEAKRERVID